MANHALLPAGVNSVGTKFAAVGAGLHSVATIAGGITQAIGFSLVPPSVKSGRLHRATVAGVAGATARCLPWDRSRLGPVSA